MTNRRSFIGAVAASVLCSPYTVTAQPGKVWRIGYLGPTSAANDPSQAARLATFHQGMRELGYSLGRDYTLDAKSADGRNERYPALAAELVASRVDVIVVPGTTGALAAQLELMAERLIADKPVGGKKLHRAQSACRSQGLHPRGSPVHAASRCSLDHDSSAQPELRAHRSHRTVSLLRASVPKLGLGLRFSPCSPSRTGARALAGTYSASP